MRPFLISSLMLVLCAQNAHAQAAPASAPLATTAPASAPVASAPAAPLTQPPSGYSGVDDSYNDCGGATYTPFFLYEVARGNESDSGLQQGVPGGTDIYQRLMVGTPHRDNCVRLLLQHIDSSMPYPGRHLSVDSASLVYVIQDDMPRYGENKWGAYVGLGATRYSGIQNLTTLDMLFDMRYRIVWRLSLEGTFSIPISNLFYAATSNYSNTDGHGLYGISLRMDWQNFGVRYGFRDIQLDTRNLSSVYTAVMFKY